MDRRNFLRSLIGGVSATSAVRTWPFRVYSFPSKVVLAKQMDDPSEALRLENARVAIPLLLHALESSSVSANIALLNFGQGGMREPYRYFRQ